MQSLSSVRSNAGQRLQAQAPVRRTFVRGGLVVEARARRAGVGLLGTKAGMTSINSEDGKQLFACTVIGFESPNFVTQKLTKELNGYDALQVGYKYAKAKNLTKAERGHCRKAGVPDLQHLVEFKVNDPEKISEYEVGTQLPVEDVFKVDDLLDLAGTSIGKGFQGSIKRWGHSRGPMTHGSKSHRQHGSIGNCSDPSRVFPNGKHAGNMGATRVTSQRLRVVAVMPEYQAILVAGHVPGKRGNLIELTPAKIIGKTIFD